MQNTKRVVKNTIFLYIKMIFSILISLYSVRLVLKALGAIDYGIFSLVAGVITMLTFLNGAMTNSSQRYISYYLGLGNLAKLKDIFSSTVLLHLIIGVVVVVLMEILGFFLFNGFLNIPLDRLETAKLIFHFMVISTFFTINAVPYDALINAHEHLVFDALIGIFESILRLLIAICIGFYEDDRLVLFGLLISGLTIVIRIIKTIYCRVKYKEYDFRVKLSLRKSKFYKEMFSFARWNMFGALAGIGKSQGIAVILNLFFGAIINASYAIANQIGSQLSSFSMMMLKAVNPQIMKKEGASDRTGMLNLAMMSSKFCFFLLAFFAIPLIFLMHDILFLWLKDVPNNTVIFCNLILMATMINQLTIGLQSAFQATGKIKMYQLVVGLLLLLNLPINYLLLYFEQPAYSVFICFIFIEVLAGVFRVVLLKSKSGLSIKSYFVKVLYPCLIVLVPSVFVCSIAYVCVYGKEIYYYIVMISILIYLCSIYLMGLRKEERIMIVGLVNSIINRNDEE